MTLTMIDGHLLLQYKLFLFQPTIDPFSEKCVNDRYQRNENKHSSDSHQAAAESYGYQHPDGRKSHRTANYMRVNKISLNLLKDQE